MQTVSNHSQVISTDSNNIKEISDHCKYESLSHDCLIHLFFTLCLVHMHLPSIRLSAILCLLLLLFIELTVRTY